MADVLRNHSGLVVAAGRLFVPAGYRLTVLTTPVTTTTPATTTYGATVTVRVHAPARAAVSLYRRSAGATTYSLPVAVPHHRRLWLGEHELYRHDGLLLLCRGSGHSVSIRRHVDQADAQWPCPALRGTTMRIGGTGVPGRSVSLYFRRAGTTTYALRAKVTVNSHGHYSASYVADATYSYYAASGCCRSKVVTTALSS